MAAHFFLLLPIGMLFIDSFISIAHMTFLIKMIYKMTKLYHRFCSKIRVKRFLFDINVEFKKVHHLVEIRVFQSFYFLR
jgi:hypothetical protein